MSCLVYLGGGDTGLFTLKHNPCAWLGPWYGSWPRITTLTCSWRQKRSYSEATVTITAETTNRFITWKGSAFILVINELFQDIFWDKMPNLFRLELLICEITCFSHVIVNILSLVWVSQDVTLSCRKLWWNIFWHFKDQLSKKIICGLSDN